MKDKTAIIEKITTFRDFLLAFSTGQDFSYEKYESQRTAFMTESAYKAVIPDWIIDHPFGSQYWSFIKGVSPTYEGRRVFLHSKFDEIIKYIEEGQAQPVSISLGSVSSKVPASKEIADLWRKVHERRENDPEGTITAAKTLLETCMKCILEERGIEYGDSEDTRDLYKKVGRTLNLSPDGHNEQLFKQIMTGIKSVIQGFTGVRNQYGDAHGKRAGSVAPLKRHAELTVNLAGTLSTFLVQTHLETLPQQKPEPDVF